MKSISTTSADTWTRDDRHRSAQTPPRVTIVITTYNRPTLLQEAVQSALTQSFSDFRLIVLDDGSTTDTASALSAFADSRLELVRNERNLGINQTMQRGFSFGDTDYFMLFADDDLLHPDFLRMCVSVLDADSTAIAACTRSWLIDEHGTKIGVPERQDTDFDARALDESEFANAYFTQSPHGRIYIAATLFRSAFLRKNELQYPDLGFARCSDDFFLAQVAATGRPIWLLPDRLYLRRFHMEMNSSASPRVIEELLQAAVVGREHLVSGDAELRALYMRFVIQSALQVTRDLPYNEAAAAVRQIRRTVRAANLTMNDVLADWGWRRHLEFSSSFSLWLVRRSQALRHRSGISK